MNDTVHIAFLERQHQEGMELAESSDLLQLLPISEPGLAVSRYIARFTCNGVVADKEGRVAPASDFHVGVWLHPGYLRRVDPAAVLTLLYPERTWHPNVRCPYICSGWLPPATPLVDILYQVFEILTYHLWSPHDPLNDSAAQWARNNDHLFPLDRRPLKRRSSPSQAGKEAS